MAYDPNDPTQAPPEGSTAWHVARVRAAAQDVWRQATEPLRAWWARVAAPLRTWVDALAYERELTKGYREELTTANEQLDRAWAIIANVDRSKQDLAWQEAAADWLYNTETSSGQDTLGVADIDRMRPHWTLGAQVAGFHHGLTDNGMDKAVAKIVAQQYVVSLITEAGRNRRARAAIPEPVPANE